jgi:predicted dehydrogenase
VAIIGYGLAGSVFHAPLIEATRGLRVAVVVTSNPERGALARARHAGVRVVPDTDALWDDTGDVDLVVVASPNRWHVLHALAAVEAGLPVVVDKPVAATIEEAIRLRNVAVTQNVPVAVFYNRRWDGDQLTVGSLLAGGRLGRVHRFESRFERWRPRVTADTWKESDDPRDAGGILYDLGTHLIDQALVLFGPVTSVYAETAKTRPGARVDDDAFVALAHASGVRSHLWASAVAAELGPRMRVLGSAAAYTTYGMDVQEAALRSGSRPDLVTGWGAVPEERWGLLGTPEARGPVPTVPGAYQRYYEHVHNAVRTGAPMPVPLADALSTVAALDAARSSALTGQIAVPAQIPTQAAA